MISLPAPQRLTLPRPDLSAREALNLMLSNAGEEFRQLPVWVLATAGGVSKRGRLIEPFAWELRALPPEPDRYIQVFLTGTGDLTFSYQRIQVPRPTPVDLSRSWIDSTAAADVVLPEPLPAGLTDRYTLFCSLAAHDQHGIVWTIDRISQDPATQMMVRHKFLMQAESRSLVGEGLTRHKAGMLIESRSRDRSMPGEWIEARRT